MTHFHTPFRSLCARFAPVLLVLAAIALVAPTTALAGDDCTATTSASYASKIAHGHAFTKHHEEFVKGKVIASLAFPDDTIGNANDFASFLDGILTASTTLNKALKNKRHGYWDARTGTVIITNQSPADCGTAFRPTSGKTYYDNLT